MMAQRQGRPESKRRICYRAVIGAALVLPHKLLDRRGVMGAALVEVSGQQHARDLTVVVLVAGVIV